MPKETVIGIVLQFRLVVLSAIEHTKNGHLLTIHIKGDDRSFLVVGNA